MPVTLLNNYPENNLEKSISKKDNSPLYGEIWLYDQFLKFNEYKLLENESWFLKHDYNLSTHPASKGKVEGQIDFVLLNKFGILIFEVKGGGLRVDNSDQYFSFNRANPEGYKTQNPFNQAKEYTHTLKELIDEGVFIYRAIVLPHEAGFQLRGPQLEGYKNLLFSKKDFENLKEGEDDKAINKIFYDFILNLAKTSRSTILRELNPSWSNEKINKKIFEKYPELSSKKIKSLKSQLFPAQSSYGYNIERINNEIIFNENYEILKGLRRNDKVLVQGAPGTGKTVLAKKFIAENYLKQFKGVVFNANKLIKSKLEHALIRDYELDSNKVSFNIFSAKTSIENIDKDVDFLVFDEAHEYFNKGLFDFIEAANKRLQNPKILVLYDPNQSIISQIEDLSFYTDYFMDAGFSHFYFDEQHRCAQNSDIAKISKSILKNTFEINSYGKADFDTQKKDFLYEVIDDEKFTSSEKIIMVNDSVLDDFYTKIKIIFKKQFEELTELNINNPSSKIRYTTPLKYRGLENKAVYLITDDFSEKNKVRNYVAVTRAMEQVKIILWKK
jgi:hypothetical protein